MRLISLLQRMVNLIGEQGPELYGREDVIVLGIDPGDMVGYSDGRDYHGATEATEFLILFDAAMWQRVVIERFHIRKVTPDAERTIAVIGGIQTLCARAMIPVAFVEPAAKRKTMRYVPDGYTNRHERDAEAVRLWDLRYGDWG